MLAPDGLCASLFEEGLAPGADTGWLAMVPAPFKKECVRGVPSLVTSPLTLLENQR